jgi:hypothetical protein
MDTLIDAQNHLDYSTVNTQSIGNILFYIALFQESNLEGYDQFVDKIISRLTRNANISDTSLLQIMQGGSIIGARLPDWFEKKYYDSIERIRRAQKRNATESSIYNYIEPSLKDLNCKKIERNAYVDGIEIDILLTL